MDEAGDVPELVAEVAAGDDGVFGEGLIHAGGAAAEDTHTKSIGTIFADHVYRVDDVAFRLAHFLTVGIQDKTMEIDLPEGDFAGDVEPHHNHAGDPSKENVGAGFHDV